jgi:hypothetical protein
VLAPAAAACSPLLEHALPTECWVQNTPVSFFRQFLQSSPFCVRAGHSRCVFVLPAGALEAAAAAAGSPASRCEWQKTPLSFFKQFLQSLPCCVCAGHCFGIVCSRSICVAILSDRKLCSHAQELHRTCQHLLALGIAFRTSFHKANPNVFSNCFDTFFFIHTLSVFFFIVINFIFLFFAIVQVLSVRFIE